MSTPVQSRFVSIVAKLFPFQAILTIKLTELDRNCNNRTMTQHIFNSFIVVYKATNRHIMYRVTMYTIEVLIYTCNLWCDHSFSEYVDTYCVDLSCSILVTIFLKLNKHSKINNGKSQKIATRWCLLFVKRFVQIRAAVTVMKIYCSKYIN